MSFGFRSLKKSSVRNVQATLIYKRNNCMEVITTTFKKNGHSTPGVQGYYRV